MPEKLQKSEALESDPSLEKQYDNETPKPKQVEEFYSMVDGLKIGLLATNRPNIGPVSRSMAIAKRDGPDFLFLANKLSQKFKDIDNDKTAQITFQDSKTQNWASITGTVTTAANDDPRIKELYGPTVSAWFGDLKDGVHNGTAEDPRMALIEVKSKHVAYWQSTVSSLGFLKEVGVAAVTGGVANTGVSRELTSSDLEQARKEK